MSAQIVRRLGRARRTLLPLGVDWRSADDPPPATVWEGNRDEWRAHLAARWLAVVLLPLAAVPVVLAGIDTDLG